MIGTNLLKNVLPTRIMAWVAAGQATNNSDVLDMAGFEGVMFICKLGDVTSGSVITMTVQESIVSGSGMATLTTDAVTYTATSATDADDDLLIIDFYRPQERYVRCVVVTATANAEIAGVIAIQYGGHVSPTTLGTTILDSTTTVSPAEA